MKKFVKILEDLTILFTSFMLTIADWISYTLRRFKVILFPYKAEFNSTLFIELNDEIVLRRHKGEVIPNELNFLNDVVVLNLQIETLNELTNDNEYFIKNWDANSYLMKYKEVLQCAEYIITELVTYKEFIETMRTTSEINLSKVYNIYFNKALKYYDEWNKEGFDNIIYKYNVELKEIEIQLKKFELNKDFAEEKLYD